MGSQLLYSSTINSQITEEAIDYHSNDLPKNSLNTPDNIGKRMKNKKL